MTTQITDHVTQALARLPEQHKDKLKLRALLSGLVGPTQAIEDALYQLLTERGVDTAIGVQLDALGYIVGQLRGGLSDDDYRRYLRARIATNRSRGLMSDIIRVSELVLNDTDAEIILRPEYPAGIVVEVQSIGITSDIADILISFLRDVVSAGVRLILEYSSDVDGETFTFGYTTYLVGSHSAGVTTLTVVSTALFPDSGSLVIDDGLAVAETKSYTGKTASSFTGVTALSNTHAADSAVQLSTGPGKGWGDEAAPSVGGKFAGAKE